MLNNKVILITGGTGSFGKYFTKFILKNYRPKKIIIFSRDELKQYEMNLELKKYNKVLRFFIGDVRDYNRLDYALNQVDFVIHTAAMKHVDISEYNPIECIKTNINGAENIIRASINNNVKKVIALSTDKAANPINLYGATKLASDKLFIAANNFKGKINIKFSIVRYGNVFASRGSIIPFFRGLIQKGSDTLPITDPKMTRFFITLEEGVKFVINSLTKMEGGEIFIPKLPSVRITDIAKSLNSKIKFKIIGKKPGEKLHEVMCPKEYAHLTINFKDYFVILPEYLSSKIKKSKYVNAKKEIGTLVNSNFDWNSKNNKNFLSIKEIKNILSKIENDPLQ